MEVTRCIHQCRVPPLAEPMPRARPNGLRSERIEALSSAMMMPLQTKISSQVRMVSTAVPITTKRPERYAASMAKPFPPPRSIWTLISLIPYHLQKNMQIP